MRQLIIVSLLILSNCSYAQLKGFSVGASGGYSNYKTFNAESYFQVNLILFNRPVQPQVGLCYHSYTTSMRNVDQLKINSIGVFGEAIIFPFYKYLFTGIRWEAYNINWFPRKTLDNLFEHSVYPYYRYSFLGTNICGIIGVELPVIKRLDFRLYATSGVQLFTIDGFEIITDGSTIDAYDIEEFHSPFTWQINIGLVYQIYQRKK